MSDHDELKEFLLRVKIRLADVFQSGFGAANENTQAELKDCAALAGQYGMETCSSLLDQFLRLLEGERHQMKKNMEPLCLLYSKLNQYIYLAMNQLELKEIERGLREEDTR